MVSPNASARSRKWMPEGLSRLRWQGSSDALHQLCRGECTRITSEIHGHVEDNEEKPIDRIEVWKERKTEGTGGKLAVASSRCFTTRQRTVDVFPDWAMPSTNTRRDCTTRAHPEKWHPGRGSEARALWFNLVTLPAVVITTHGPEPIKLPVPLTRLCSQLYLGYIPTLVMFML